MRGIYIQGTVLSGWMSANNFVTKHTIYGKLLWPHFISKVFFTFDLKNMDQLDPKNVI